MDEINNGYIHIYIYTYVYIYICSCICICIYMYICLYICICTYGLGLKTHWIVFVNKKLLECNVCVHIYTGICVYSISFGSILRKKTC